MNPAADLKRIIGHCQLKELVVLPSGKRCEVVPSVASTDDALLNEAVVSGYTKTLVCNSQDVEDLVPLRDYVIRSGKKFQVTGTTLMAKGYVTKVFLGDAL